MKYFIPLLLGFMVLTKPIFAHPPSEIELGFDPFEYALWATILHSVSNASKHYIYKVTVELNGKEIIKQEFKTQWSDKEQLVVYKIPDAQHGDEITVNAYCSISGKKKATIKIIEDEVPELEE